MNGNAIFKEFQDDSGTQFSFALQTVEDAVTAVVGSNDVLVEICACCVSTENQQLLRDLFAKKRRVSAASCVSGVVCRVGAAVTACGVGDRVVGMLSLDSDCSGCANFCLLNEFDLVRLPESVDDKVACSSLNDGVRAYTALHYLARLDAGESVLILDAAHGAGYFAIQLALKWGAKVFAVVSNGQERSQLQTLQPAPAHILEVDVSSSTLVSTVMEETGRLGVDVIIDNGVRQFTSDTDSLCVNEDISRSLPSKQMIISCLAVGGRWVTVQPMLQLDPPNSLQLFLRCASVSFLFDQCWMLAPARHGKWLHIARDIVNALAQGALRPNIEQVIPFSQAVEVLNNYASQMSYRKTIVIEMSPLTN